MVQQNADYVEKAMSCTSERSVDHTKEHVGDTVVVADVDVGGVQASGQWGRLDGK